MFSHLLQCLLFDFRPINPEDIVTAMRVLMLLPVPGRQ